MRVLAHMDFAGSIRILQMGEVEKGSYSRWYSQDIEMEETEVNGIHIGE